MAEEELIDKLESYSKDEIIKALVEVLGKCGKKDVLNALVSKSNVSDLLLNKLFSELKQREAKRLTSELVDLKWVTVYCVDDLRKFYDRMAICYGDGKMSDMSIIPHVEIAHLCELLTKGNEAIKKIENIKSKLKELTVDEEGEEE